MRTSTASQPVEVGTPDPGDRPDHIAPQVPEVTNVQAFVHRDSLHVRGQLGTSTALRPYEPARPGGWALQILIDSDLENGGYWLGFDYVVRGSEWLRDPGTFATRQITLEPQYPGGWGPQSGDARFRQRPRHFEVVLPLNAIGAPQGDLFLAIETFATVTCPHCTNGFSHEWAQTAFQPVNGVVLAPATSRRRAMAVEMTSGRRASSSMDADPALRR